MCYGETHFIASLRGAFFNLRKNPNIQKTQGGTKMKNYLTEMNLSVMKQTAAFIEHCADLLNLTEGEVLDRIIMGVNLKSPEMSALVACEFVVMATTQQSKEQVLSTAVMAAAYLFKCVMLQEMTFDEATEKIKSQIDCLPELLIK